MLQWQPSDLLQSFKKLRSLACLHRGINLCIADLPKDQFPFEVSNNACKKQNVLLTVCFSVKKIPLVVNCTALFDEHNITIPTAAFETYVGIDLILWIP